MGRRRTAKTFSSLLSAAALSALFPHVVSAQIPDPSLVIGITPIQNATAPGYLLRSDPVTGKVLRDVAGGGGGGSPGGPNRAVQFNDGGTFGGDAALEWVANVLSLGTPGSIAGTLSLAGSTSGTLTITTPATTANWTLTLPPDDGTVDYVLRTDGSGVTTWVPQSGGGGGAHAPINAVQFNNPLGTFDGTADFTWVTGPTAGAGLQIGGAVDIAGTTTPGTGLEHVAFGSYALIDNPTYAPNDSVEVFQTGQKAVLVVNEAFTAEAFGIVNYLSWLTLTSISQAWGLDTQAVISTDSTGTFASLIGINQQSTNFGQGDVTDIIGANAFANHQGGGHAGYVVGLWAQSDTTRSFGPLGNGTCDYVIGVKSVAEGSAIAAGTAVYGVESQVVARKNGAFNVTNPLGVGVQIDAAHTDNLSGFTDLFGLRIADQTGISNVTNNWNLASLGSSSRNLFEGSVLFAGASSGIVTVKAASTAGTWTFSLPNSGGTSGYVLSTNGSGVTSWIPASSGSPGGANTNVQFNNSGAFGGAADFVWGSNTLTLGLAGTSTGKLALAGTTSGTVNITPKAIAGAWTLTLPDTGGTSGYVLSTNGSGVTSWIPAGGAATLIINTSPITGSTGNDVLYGDGTLLQQAANLQITSGNPNVSNTNAYLYASQKAVQGTVAGATTDNWFLGGAGNVTLSGTSNFGEGPTALSALTTGSRNMAQGSAALAAVTSGKENVAIGARSQVSNINGDGNMSMGFNSLAAATGVFFNTAIGTSAMESATAGNSNVAIGSGTLQFNQADSNVAMGGGALNSNTTGDQNIAIGSNAMRDNLIGPNNVALGQGALQVNTDGQRNIAIGKGAISGHTSGFSNTAIGYLAGRFITGSPTGNTFIGSDSGSNFTSGDNNVFIGYAAGNAGTSASGSNNVGMGQGCMQNITGGNKNVAVGVYPCAIAIVNGSNNLILGDGVNPSSDISDGILIGCHSVNHLDYNYTNSGKWTFQQDINIVPMSTAGILVNDASGNVTHNHAGAAATVAANFTADHRLQVNIGGTTYYLAASTTAW